MSALFSFPTVMNAMREACARCGDAAVARAKKSSSGSERARSLGRDVDGDAAGERQRVGVAALRIAHEQAAPALAGHRGRRNAVDGDDRVIDMEPGIAVAADPADSELVGHVGLEV